jgi:hypothetical protein
MKKHILFTGALAICALGHSQTPTILHSETFEAGGSGITMNTPDMGSTGAGENPWVLNNAYAGGSSSFMCMGFPIPFTVPAAATQPAGITNNPTSTYLHITPQIAIAAGGTVPAASYVVADGFCIFGGQNTFTRMSTDVSTVGQDSVTLDLWWMCGGSATYYGEVYYSINGGMAWLPVNNPISGTAQWSGQVNWVNSIVYNANWDGQPTLRFGFRFVSAASGTGSELDPGFAIDDIEITGYVNTPGCSETTSTISPTACDSYTSPSGNYTWSVSNTYMDTIPNVEGCDSVITINLTINSVDESVTQTGNTLMADNAGLTYQWLDCDNAYAAIPGATNQSYTPVSNGNYALKATGNGCTDTSACFNIFDLGISEQDNQLVMIYPNPATDLITINTGTVGNGTVVITDVLGREVLAVTFISNTTTIPLNNMENSTYFVQVFNSDGALIAVRKLVKK